MLPLNEMSEEHAPQKGGQSRLGPAVTVVLTCQDCNNSATLLFEGEADSLVKGEAEDLTVEQIVDLRRLRQIAERPIDVRLEVQPLAFQLTDLKAAFVLAFAVLGYEWALSEDLWYAREALEHGRELDPIHGRILRVDNSAARGNVVMEVGPPHPCVIVHASVGTAVVLPIPGHPEVPKIEHLRQFQARTYEWPRTFSHAKINEVERAFLSGTLFHADICHSHQLAEIPKYSALIQEKS